MGKKILILFFILSLTACGTTQVAELSTTAVESKIETTTVAETTTIVETSEEIKETVETTAEETTVEETTIPDKWDGYSDEVREIIAKAEGKDYATSKKLTQEERNKLHSAGLYMITKDVTKTRSGNEVFSSGGSTEFLTKNELENFISSVYYFNQEKQILETNSSFAIWDSVASDIARDVKSQIQSGGWKAREDSREEKARTFVKKNEDPNSPAQYINALGNGNYIEKCGLVVPSEENAIYYESLKGEDKTIYKYTEWMVFKQNNQSKITIVKDRAVPKAKYKENTFYDMGEGNFGAIMWVSRTPNEQRVDYTGKTYYAHVNKTFPEYYDKCGGTDMAFFQWGNNPMAYSYDYCYNKIVEGVFDKESQFKNLMDCEWWN